MNSEQFLEAAAKMKNGNAAVQKYKVDVDRMSGGEVPRLQFVTAEEQSYVEEKLT